MIKSTLPRLVRVLRERFRTTLMTPTQLLRVLNSELDRRRQTRLSSTQELARLLRAWGLTSQVRTVPGRSERRWYDLASFDRPEDHETPHERPDRQP